MISEGEGAELGVHSGSVLIFSSHDVIPHCVFQL